MKGVVMRKRAPILLVGVFVVGGLGLEVTSQVEAESQDSAAVQGVFQASQVAQQTLDIMPGGDTGSKAVTISDAAMTAWHDRINGRLQELYAGPRLAQIERVMNFHATEQQGNPSRMIGGGVDSIRYRTVSIDGNTATVVARVAKWLEWANADAQGHVQKSVTRGVVNFQDTLERTPSGWRITDEKFLSFGDNGASGP